MSEVPLYMCRLYNHMLGGGDVDLAENPERVALRICFPTLLLCMLTGAEREGNNLVFFFFFITPKPRVE